MQNNVLKMIDWAQINTVLLDMDGTLLDLHYDDQFWQQHLPAEYAKLNGLTVAQAKAELTPRFNAMAGKLEWYCLDYWSKELQLDIPELKTQVAHLIAIHDGVIEFLNAARKWGKSILLVTNAHPKVLRLKMQHSQLENLFDQIISSHEFGLPKENTEFWHRLVDKHYFAPEHTLFIDDSTPVLKSAQKFGIRYLLDIEKPSSQRPAKTESDFIMLRSFKDLIPDQPG